MKKSLIMLLMVVSVAVSKASTTNAYVINDAKIEAAFNEAKTVDFSNDNSISSELPITASPMAVESAKNPYVGAALAWFLGGWGIHRIYLGASTGTWILYPLTCGGACGVIPFVDMIVLLTNADKVEQYVNNNKFVMW